MKVPAERSFDFRRGTSWEDHVRKIAGEARSNDINPMALPEMGRESADRFLGYFPEPDCDDEATGALLAVAEEALASIDLVYDDTRGTRVYVDLLQMVVAVLKRDACPWWRWISLSKNLPTKKSEVAALPVMAAASCYDRHGGFQRDIRSYIEGVFAIAGKAIDRFQELKTERGLVDYDDMEQLALFMKLARFARGAIFVGDVKQAIFGFRGADPELVHRALDEMAARGCDVDVLGSSWRSRPALLRYLNTVFVGAFERDGVERARVELAPERAETDGAPAVVQWTVPTPRAGDAADLLALAISDYVRSGHPVTDPATRTTRPVAHGDIAVLAAQNTHVENIAKALRSRRVPMKMTLAGLLETPEVGLARACLRRLNDPTDTLATAEIRALGSCEEPEAWLADRLRWLAAGEEDRRWSETDDPIVSRIARLRGDAVTESPAETVARALNYVGVRPVVVAWGPGEVAAEHASATSTPSLTSPSSTSATARRSTRRRPSRASSDLAMPEPPHFAPAWFAERVPTESPLRERLAPSGEEPAAHATVGEVLEVGPRIAVHGDDMGKIGTALHAVIAAELVNPGCDDAVDRAAALIRTAAGEGAVAPADAVDCARRLRTALNARFAPRRMLVEHPVELIQENGQVLHGWIDLLLETEAGWIVVDHKSSPRPRLEWPTRRSSTRASSPRTRGRFEERVSSARGAGCAFRWGEGSWKS